MQGDCPNTKTMIFTKLGEYESESDEEPLFTNLVQFDEADDEDDS